MGSLNRKPVEVHRVVARHDRRQFVRFPHSVYRGDPSWVAPLERERLDFINPHKHPFYQHGEAIQLLARRNGQVCGRIQVSDDPNYNATHDANAGCFGLFECANDPEVATALLRAADQWLAARGRDTLIGPIDYSTNYSCGLLVEGFDTPPRVMMNHNPPYYAKLLDQWGLTKAKDLYCWWFEDAFDMVERWKQKAKRLAARGRVTIRALNPHDVRGELERVKIVYRKAWNDHWGFVTMSDAEMLHFANFLVDLAIPEMLLLAEVDGQPVGVALTLPDLNEAIQPLNGRLMRWGLPLGYWQFRSGLKQIRACRLFALGITKGYRRRGVAELLILRTLDYGKNIIGYTGAELGWTLEDNDLINRTIERVGGLRYKTYRIYQRGVS